MVPTGSAGYGYHFVPEPDFLKKGQQLIKRLFYLLSFIHKNSFTYGIKIHFYRNMFKTIICKHRYDYNIVNGAFVFSSGRDIWWLIIGLGIMKIVWFF